MRSYVYNLIREDGRSFVRWGCPFCPFTVDKSGFVSPTEEEFEHDCETLPIRYN